MESIPYYGGKQKINLSLRKDIIERAKEKGINISAITENILKAITYQPRKGTDLAEEVARGYEALFQAAKPVLQKYNIGMEIGNNKNRDESANDWLIVLDGTHGLVHVPPAQDDFYRIRNSISELIPYLYNPIRILENFVEALIEADEKNKLKIKELEFALRFIKTLSNEGENKIVNSKKRASE